MKGCFAYNRDGLRCDGEGGHDGPHTLTIEWDDDDVWTPETPPTAPALAVVPPPMQHPVLSVNCDLCEHPWHDGPCPACDCRQAI